MDDQKTESGHIIKLSAAHLRSEENMYLRNRVCGVAGAACGFSDAISSSKESKKRTTSMWKLWAGIVLSLIVMSVEFIGGKRAKSLAILADAAHMLSDVAAFAISLVSVWASGWKATPRHSYGFLRIEILGTLASILGIWVLTAILVYEAAHRLIHGIGEVKGSLMFGIASFGLVVNILMMFILGHDHDQQRGNTNVQGAYLHILGDLIQSIGVMIGAGVVWYKPKLKIIDPICTLLFSVIVLYTTIKILRDTLEVLMESTPRKIDAPSLEKGLCEIDGVVSIHEFHIWAITIGKVLLACHIRIRPEVDADMVLHNVVDYTKREYNISHATIQIERE